MPHPKLPEHSWSRVVWVSVETSIRRIPSYSGNFTVDTDTLIVNSTTDRVGINKAPHVVGDVVITDDFTVDTDTLRVDSVTDRVGINVSAPNDAIVNLEVANLTVDTNTLHVTCRTKVGILTVNPAFALDVHGTRTLGR